MNRLKKVWRDERWEPPFDMFSGPWFLWWVVSANTLYWGILLPQHQELLQFTPSFAVIVATGLNLLGKAFWKWLRSYMKSLRRSPQTA